MSTDNYLCDLKEYTIKKKSIPYHKKSMLRKKKDKGQKMFLKSPSDISLHSNFSESEYEEYKFQHLYLLNLIVFFIFHTKILLILLEILLTLILVTLLLPITVGCYSKM